MYFFYTPSTNNFGQSVDMPTARAYAAAAVLPGNRMIVTGGTDGADGVRASTDIMDRTNITWSAGGTMTTPRFWHTLSSLPNGDVLAVGGADAVTCNCTKFTARVDRYDVASNTWVPAKPLITARNRHTATVLQDGRILVAGGYGGTPNASSDTGGPLASAEIYDPATGNWTATGSLHTARRSHAAVLLGDGRVLIAGGNNTGAALPNAEIYDPASGIWTNVASMGAARESPSITALTNGRIMVVNGFNSSSTAFGVGTAEIYDPVANSWSTPIPLTVPRIGGVALALDDGRVVVFGGLPSYSGVPEYYR